MPKLYLLVIICICYHTLYAQTDFIVFKKKQTTLQTFFKGSYLSCYLINDEWLNGYVRKIQNDSIYLKPFYLQVFYDPWGLPHTDTIFMGATRIGINQIKGMPKKQSVVFVRDGSILQIGAGAYMLLNIINTLGNNEHIFESRNIKNLGIAAGVFTIGTVIKLLRSPFIKLGKKYHLDYIQLHPTSH